MRIASHGTLRRAKLGLIPGSSCCQIQQRLVYPRSQEGHFPNPFEDSFRQLRAACCVVSHGCCADSGGHQARNCEKSRGKNLSACLSQGRCRDPAKPAHACSRRMPCDPLKVLAPLELTEQLQKDVLQRPVLSHVCQLPVGRPLVTKFRPHYSFFARSQPEEW